MVMRIDIEVCFLFHEEHGNYCIVIASERALSGGLGLI